MTERPVEPQDYGSSTLNSASPDPARPDQPGTGSSSGSSTTSAADRTSTDGPPPAANQSKAEPGAGEHANPAEPVGEAAPAAPTPADEPAAPFAAAPPGASAPSARAGRTAQAVPGRPDGEVDTSR
ncbi:MAG TPA: hypothetical protein VNB94_10930 [Mycobacteriales bacterium]|nr:hypothetical protein [Mycobacteriales bacterium]